MEECHLIPRATRDFEFSPLPEIPKHPSRGTAAGRPRSPVAELSVSYYTRHVLVRHLQDRPRDVAAYDNFRSDDTSMWLVSCP